MYELINTNLQAILESIPQSHVTEYDFLMQSRNLALDPEYQRRYRSYWQLNAARLSPDFCSAYFTTLQMNRNNFTSLSQVMNQLYQMPTNANGKSLQFSFSSKLVHTVNPHSPIYDSMVASYYFYSEPKRTSSLSVRISGLLTFHQFLVAEYQRVLNLHLLTTAIQEFRQRFNPRAFTDEKVIDSLIWAFVTLLKKGGTLNRTIVYR